MIEKIGRISNPLTIIAMFAALAEVSGTVVLPLVKENLQYTFLQFLMFFPIMLVLLFFGTLLLKHTVLYAPSDFRDDKTFADLVTAQSSSQQKQKLDDDIEGSGAPKALAPSTKRVAPSVSTPTSPQLIPDLRSTYLQAEDLVFRSLQSESNISFQRQVRVGKLDFPFDGIARLKNEMLLVEVKFVKSISFARRMIQNPILLAAGFADELKKLSGIQVSLLLAVVIDVPRGEEDALRLQLNKAVEEAKAAMISKEIQNRVTLRVFPLDELKASFGFQ